MNSPLEPWKEDEISRYVASDDRARFSTFDVVNPVLRYRRVLVLSVGLGLAAGVGYALMQVPTYEAAVRFVTSPGTNRAVAGVGGDLGPVQQRDPFEYYTGVLTSSQVLDAVLATKVADGATIRDRLGVPPDAEPQAARAVLAGVSARLESSSRTRTITSFPVLMIKTASNEPQMAADLANAFFDALSDCDQAIRSSAARERKTFIATQIEETTKSLTAAEDKLKTFRESNRLLIPMTGEAVGTRQPVPPELELRRDQLQREVTVQSELYLTLKKAFDQARIAELDDASALVAIERAMPPESRSGVARRRLVGLGGLIGLVIGMVLSTAFEIRRRADLSSPGAQEFVGHLGDIRQDLTGLRARAAQALSPPPAQPSVTDQSSVKRDA